MELTREQINEAKNFPTEKIKAKSKAIKDTLSGIESTKMESDASKAGMPAGLKKEVATKVTGPIASLRKKLKETVDNKKATDDLSSNLASKKALERMEKEAQKIKSASVALNKKVAAALSKSKVNAANTAVAQKKAKSGYEAKKAKDKKDRDFAANKYAAESVDFKTRVRGYLKKQYINEMSMADFAPDAEKKYSKEELAEFFKKGKIPALADVYVKNSHSRGLTDSKIRSGLGATLRNIEDKDKVAKVKEAVRAKLEPTKAETKKATAKKSTAKSGDADSYDKSKDRPDAGKKAAPSFLKK